jgi:hypothetical protein
MGYWDGTATREIAVHVSSSDSGDPVPGATVRLSFPDQPSARIFAEGGTVEGITDSNGVAVLRSEFDASGMILGPGGWNLTGRLSVEKDGFEVAQDWMITYAGRSGYPMNVERVQVSIRLDPDARGLGGAVVVTFPVTFDPYRGLYSFGGRLYGSNFLNMGYTSLVDAIAAAGPMDPELSQDVLDYRKGEATSEALLWTSALALVGALALDIAVPANSPDKTLYYVSAGVSIAAGVACLAGMLMPGRPIAVVDTYNKANKQYPGDDAALPAP